MRRYSGILLVLLTAAPFLLSNGARAELLWQIGTFDESSHEFHSGAAVAVDPVFVVGTSKAAQDWYSYQPGTSNGQAGFRAHPFTVRFELPRVTQGLYRLKLSLLAYSPRLPILEVSVNGHRGRFFQHPVLNYAGGDMAGQFLAHYAASAMDIDLPTRRLQAGTNTIVLTAIDDPAERDDSRGATVTGNSGITYDAVALEVRPAETYSAEGVSVQMQPTIFYVRKEAGLAEVIEVFVRYHEAPEQGRITLNLGSSEWTRDLAPGTDFGEQRLRFEVPEFTSATPAKVSVLLNGRSQTFSAELKPARKWNLFVAPHQHMDIGYTDYVPKVKEVQSRAIDEAIDLIREHPDFRYTLDSYWPAEQFLAGRSDAQRREFLRLIAEKKIIVPANYAGNYTGLPSLEYLLRSFYHSYKLNRANGGDFDHAIITDIPSHSWSYPSLMAAAGLKYLLLPCNNDLGPMLLFGRLHERSPFWWEGPDGQRVLTWYSRHYHQVFSLFGMAPKVEAGRDSLPTFLQIYDRPEYKSDGVLVFGTQVENTDLYREQASLASEWNKRYAYPRMQVSGVAEALRYIAAQMGDSIPVIRGNGGPYWDVFSAGQAYYTALARENEQRVLAAEKFSTISSLVNPRIFPDRDDMQQLWKGLLAYQEHTNSGGRSGTLRARHSKDLLAMENARLVEDLLARSLSALADAIPNPSGTLIVFNPLNWQRSELVQFNLGMNQELVDLATGREVRAEEIPRSGTEAPGARRGPASRRIRFLAADVPAVGYKCYQIRQAKTPAVPVSAGAEGTLENSYYRIKLDPATGALQSVFDKELNREMADAASPYRFGQFVVATGTQDPRNRSALSTKIVPPPDLRIHRAAGGRVISVSTAPFGSVARLESSAPNNTRVATEIILFDGQKKIEIIHRLQKEPAVGEWGYVAFPFAIERPRFRFEIQNGVVDPAQDALPGGAREWSVVQHWAAVDQDDVTAAVVPVDAPLVAFGDIVRWRWPKEFGARQATIFSYAYQGAGGGQELTFRYLITTGRKLAPGLLSKIGWSAMSPFEANEVIAQDKVGNPPRALDPAQHSFVTVDQPGVVLVTWKRAEDENGTIMRFVEVNGQPAQVKVTTPGLNLEGAWLANAVEENLQPLAAARDSFSFEVKPFEVVTVRLAGSPRN